MFIIYTVYWCNRIIHLCTNIIRYQLLNIFVYISVKMFLLTEDPKLSVVEYIMQLSLFIEKNILYPLTFIFAFNLSAHYYKFKFGDM